jgi:hypothetical protein
MAKMMADGDVGTLPWMPPEAREIVVADEPEAWAALGFALDGGGAARLGGVRLVAAGRRLGEGIVSIGVAGLAAGAERPDGLPLVAADGAPGGDAAAHPNGAVAIDHVVAFTGDMDRTLAALERSRLDLRRLREPPEAPVRQAFLRLGPFILELAETGAEPPALWGLVVVVADLDAAARRLGDRLGRPRDAGGGSRPCGPRRGSPSRSPS